MAITLKKLIYDILLVSQECRNSDKKLQWEVLKYLDLIDRTFDTISKENFIKAPEMESIRRVRQQLQREDLLTGRKFIQPAIEVKKTREKLSREKGYQFIQGEFNPIKQVYEI
jgi:hypothetical protein